MNRRYLQKLLSCWVAAVLAPGCYADSVTAPEPTLTTPGAFIAVPFEPFPNGAAGAAGQAGHSGAADNLYRLIRVLVAFDVKTDLAIFHFPYGVVDSLEEARQATKLRGSGPPPPVSIVSLASLESLEAVVVGYRSLTEEEKDAIR